MESLQFKTMKEKVQHLEKLLEVNLFLSSTLNLKDLLRRIMEVSRSTMKAEAASLLLLDEKGEELSFEVALGEEASVVAPLKIRVGQGIVGKVAETGEPLLVADAQRHPQFLKAIDKVSGFVTRSILCVPLKTRTRTIGVLELLNKEEVEHFDEEDLERACAMANVAAVAIENARLYEAQEKLLKTIRDLEQSKSQFISVISHELRTPLVPIKGYACLLKKSPEKITPEAQNSFLDDILWQVDHLTMLIDDLFIVNDIETIRFNLDLEPCSFDVILKEAQSVKPVPGSHTFKLEISPDLLSPGSSSPVLRVDRLKFTHALVHLLDNAIKFSPDGGAITLSISPSRTSKEVVLSISDEGIGIPPQFQDRLFEKFFQIDSSSTRKFGGTGIGLYIVRKIVNAHGGKISYRSEGKGTTFLLTFPDFIIQKDGQTSEKASP